MVYSLLLLPPSHLTTCLSATHFISVVSCGAGRSAPSIYEAMKVTLQVIYRRQVALDRHPLTGRD